MKGARKPFRGEFDFGVNAAWSGDGSDFDLNQYLRVMADPPQCERLHIRGAIWLNEDLGGDLPRYSSLRDINDGWDSDVRIRPLHLYAEYDDAWGDSTLRVGRQRILEGAAFNRIDGVYFKQRVGIWDWYVFAGTRATLYDDAFRDPVFGGGASVRLDEKTRIALDAYYGNEHRDRDDEIHPGFIDEILGRDYPRSVRSSVDDTAFSLSAWRVVTPNLTLHGRVDVHEGRGDEILLDASGVIPSLDVSYELSYHRQLNALSDRVADLTGYYRILGDSNAHDNFFIALRKPISKRLSVALETEIHEANGSDWMTANRDYQRYSLALTAEDILKNFDAEIAVERWNVDGAEGSWAVTGEITRRWEKIRLTFGVDYSRYEDRIVNYSSAPYLLDQLRVSIFQNQYQGYNPLVYLFDTYALELHEDVYSFYVKTNWAFVKDQELSAGVAYEEDDSDESPYWRLKAQYSIKF
jgi:hypothetical protein